MYMHRQYWKMGQKTNTKSKKKLIAGTCPSGANKYCLTQEQTPVSTWFITASIYNLLVGWGGVGWGSITHSYLADPTSPSLPTVL